MGAQRIPAPVTVEEYERLPEPRGGRYELRHGEVVLVAYPIWLHKELQRRLRKMLEVMAEPWGDVVDTESPYRPLPENEVWAADVACVSGPRDRVEKWLMGSPELAIEVMSLSNTKAEMHDKAMTTLAGEGAAEFWVVDPQTRSATVYVRSSGIHVYQQDLAVPVSLFHNHISLAPLFAGL